MENLFIFLAIVFLAYQLWQLRDSSDSEPVNKKVFVLPPGVTLTPQPLLTDADLLLYNLIRMAAQDHFLVFARVPLWSILSVEGEGKARLQVLRKIALKQLDFVLVHPGSKIVAQVVLLGEGLPPQSEEVARRREIQAVLKAAGIPLVILKPGTSYTVAQLAQLFGVGEDE